MRNERLYINGQLADISAGTLITLNIKSNLFAEMGTFTANRTYSIKLPLTAHNRVIFGLVDDITAETAAARRKHAARYVLDDVEIIKNGVAVILGVSDGIEISILWGIATQLAALQDSELMLNELQYTGTVPFNKVRQLTAYTSARIVNTAIYADFDTERKKYDNFKVTLTPATGSVVPNTDANDDKCYLHPSVRCDWLFSRIKETTGVSFSWDNATNTRLRSWIVPCITKKSVPSSASSIAVAPVTGEQETGEWLTFNALTTNAYIERVDDITLRVKVAFAGTMRLLLRGVLPTNLGYNNRCRDIIYRIQVTRGGNEEITTIHSGITGFSAGAVDSSGNISLTEKVEGLMAFSAGDLIKIRRQPSSGSLSTIPALTGGDSSLTFYNNTVGDEKGDIITGLPFPIAPNLPAIKVLDFVKFIATIAGAFPLQNVGGDSVSFIPRAKVWENKARASDWSQRIIGKSDKPRKIRYTLGEWAQRNNYKWHEDSTVTGDYNAAILINNANLPKERDAVVFPFAATDGNHVPLYTPIPDDMETAEDESKQPATFEAVQPRILTLYMRDVKAAARFDIDLQGVLNTAYAEIREALEDARVITEQIHISAAEVLAFDESVPVYIGKYGAYFAVLEMKTSGNNTAEVELIKIS